MQTRKPECAYALTKKNRPHMQINVHQLENGYEAYKDENVSIVPVLLSPSLVSRPPDDGTEMQKVANEINLADDKAKWQKTLSSVFSTCFVCTGPVKPGKFNPVAAKKLGIKPGPDFGETCS